MTNIYATIISACDTLERSIRAHNRRAWAAQTALQPPPARSWRGILQNLARLYLAP